MHVAKRVSAALVAVVVAGVMAGCSAGDGQGESEDGLTHIKVIVSPVVDGAPVYYAAANGLFEEHGLEVEVTTAVSGGPAMIPILLNGDIQMGATGPGTVVPVWRQDLPVKMIAPLTVGATSVETATDRIVATVDSGVTSLADLPGHTIAVPTLNNMGEITIGALLDSEGIDPASVNYTLVPYVEQQAAFESGAIDIAFATEPYITLIQETTPLNVLGAPGLGIGPGIPNFMVVALDRYIDENPDIVRSFQEAVFEANEFLAANPEEARKFSQTFTDIDDTVLETMNMPNFSNDQNLEGLQEIADAAFKYKIIDKEIDVSKETVPYPLP